MKEILKNHSILYAEDDKALQLATVEYLQRYFKEVHVASDGKEALELYKKCQPHVLLLDIDMPYVDGLSVAGKVRQSDEGIPIVMMTAFTDTDMLLEATELNLCTYLVKPVKASQFKEALQKVSLKLKSSTKKVFDAQEKGVNLSLKEQTLLDLLAKHPKHCVSFEEIMAVVWEDTFDKEITIDSVKYHVSQLRKKLPNDTIENVYEIFQTSILQDGIVERLSSTGKTWKHLTNLRNLDIVLTFFNYSCTTSDDIIFNLLRVDRIW